MAWVPLVGSALGSLIGGLLSDFFIRTLLTKSPSDEDDVDGDDVTGSVCMGDEAGRLILSLNVCMYVCMK